MDKKPQYRLHAKYENIPLDFGSPILVNNANITPEYAQKLLQKNGSRYFAYIPTQEELLQADEVQKLNSIPGKEPGLDDDDALDNESNTP